MVLLLLFFWVGFVWLLFCFGCFGLWCYGLLWYWFGLCCLGFCVFWWVGGLDGLVVCYLCFGVAGGFLFSVLLGFG